MVPAIITDELVNRVVQLLITEAGITEWNISYEIQDNFQFLLFRILVDKPVGPNQLPTFKKVAHLLNKLMPSRKGEYSWMVNFMSDGKIVDSYFGGDSNCPNSGL